MANPKNKWRDAGDEQTDVNHICDCGDEGWQVKPNTVKLRNTALKHVCFLKKSGFKLYIVTKTSQEKAAVTVILLYKSFKVPSKNKTKAKLI